MRLVGATVVAWAAGLGAYFGVGWFVWHQRLSPGDLRAVVFSSLVAVLISVVAGYAPLMSALSRYAFFQRRAWTFPVAGAVFGIIPLCVGGALLGGRGSLSSPEVLLFGCMFAMFGLVFGAAFFRLSVRGSA